MKFFNQKRGMIGWSALISVILGLVVIGAVVIGVIGPGVGFAKKKFFDEESSESMFPWKEQEEFEPYVPEEHYNEEERIVSNSMKAMECSLNSVAVGMFDYENRDVCPSGYTVPSDEQNKVVALFSKLVTRRDRKSIEYGKSSVSCSGISSEFLSFKDKSEEEPTERENVIEILGYAVKDCLVKSKKTVLNDHYVLCARFDASELKGPNKWEPLKPKFNPPITKDTLKKYFDNRINKENDIELKQEWKEAKRYLGEVELDEIPFYRQGCVYYDKTPIFQNKIHIKECSKNNPVDEFSCFVESFELPQDVSDSIFNKVFLQALGDPKYLVYYEEFPKEAEAYWHKEWSDMINLFTISYITLAGPLNVAGGKGKLAKEAAEKASKKLAGEAGEEAAEKLAKEAAETAIKSGSKHLFERVKFASTKNIMKSLALEEETILIYGVGRETSKEIGTAVAKKFGVRSGSVVFERFKNLEKDLIGEIYIILNNNNIRRPQHLIDAKKPLEEYRRELAEKIVKGGGIDSLKEGVFIKSSIKGVKEIFENELTKEAKETLLKKQTYRQFFNGLLKKGTTEVDDVLFKEAGETAFLKLNALQKVDERLVEKSLLKGAQNVGNILLKGTIGYEKKGTVLATALDLGKKQIPLAFPSLKWAAVTGPGYIPLTMAKSVTVGVPRWVKNHPLPTAVLLSVLIDSMDSKNEKLTPVGVNDIALTQPKLLADKITYNLNEEATKYFIRNQERPSNVMYLVSPCKTDFRVVKRKCDCTNDKEASIFDFGGGLMNVEKGTITLKDYEERVEEYERRWQRLPEDEKERFDNLDSYVDYKVGDGKNGDVGLFNYIIVNQGKSFQSFSKQIKLNKEYINEYQNIIDESNAVKKCDSSGRFKDPHQIHYSIDCIELEIDKKEGYCYDDFPVAGYIRTTISATFVATDIYLSTLTGFLGTVPVRWASGSAFAAVDVMIGMLEKWPGSDVPGEKFVRRII
ncbi:hypothetical protein CEE44_02490 [Candidatus Woesearchaeota archaeon B3_Woes]|nr:MAG: hypothetical protein CEE44_02490 [Candidatus Woesearchaeota archaeon B3_Woes]